ncbi:helix-turn-helix domain-containing protein [Mucilaginibacter sp. 5C4]|uniref:helix-turn-helix domain-containing protein n=1 Tax=Mucilaginibacter sp. 5C4 TaxID=3048589 RepID=UPI002AC98D8C|nr:helix-turn-helix domain-containing protein [Mucilaginibacter sp. 5C4]WPX22509.1 helix-turn-helix domain-containing protein [Mucilaginibacter sp. 5C4]
MDSFNFNELPEVIRLLFEKVEKIEFMIINLQPKEIDENELMDITEAAQFLKVTVASLYTKVSRKEIPVSKPGKRLYFNRSELQNWIKLSRKKRRFKSTLKQIIIRKGTRKRLITI